MKVEPTAVTARSRTEGVREERVKNALKILWLKKRLEHKGPKLTTGEADFRDNDMIKLKGPIQHPTGDVEWALMNLRERSRVQIQYGESSAQRYT